MIKFKSKVDHILGVHVSLSKFPDFSVSRNQQQQQRVQL